MDSDYIISRLRATPFKYPTVSLLSNRLGFLNREEKEQVLTSLKKQLYAERNIDIQLPLAELLRRAS